MRIPKKYKGRTNEKREQYLHGVRDACYASRQERQWYYNYLSNWFLSGTKSGSRARVNTLRGTIEMMSAYLYQGETLRFALSHRDWSEEQSSTYSQAFSRMMHEDGLDMEIEQAVLWSLNFGAFIVKLQPSQDRRGCAPYLIDPGHFGVLREDITRLSRQRAMCQRYAMSRDDALETLSGRPDVGRDSTGTRLTELMRKLPWSPYGTAGGGDANSPLRAFATSVNPSGNTQGFVYSAGVATPTTPRVRTPVVWTDELWIWDDDLAKDLSRGGTPWRVVKMAVDSDLILYDGPAPYGMGEQPFRVIQPFPLKNYFWGISWLEAMLGAQDWRNERLREIRLNQQLQNDPAYSTSGTSQARDKTFSLRRPGANVALGPNAKVTDHRPPVIENAGEELNMIDSQISLVSQVNELLKAGGGRNEAHAMAIASLAAVTMKKAALRVETQIRDIGDLGFKISRGYNNSDYQGVAFASLPKDTWVSIMSHCTSPLFGYQNRVMANALLEAKAIGPVQYVDLINPPERDELRKVAEKLEKAAAAMAEKELDAKIAAAHR